MPSSRRRDRFESVCALTLSKAAPRRIVAAAPALQTSRRGHMTSAQNESQALGDLAARQLANATKTVPQLSTITPRFLLHLLSWVPVEAGVYRVNRVVNRPYAEFCGVVDVVVGLALVIAALA